VVAKSVLHPWRAEAHGPLVARSGCRLRFCSLVIETGQASPTTGLDDHERMGTYQGDPRCIVSYTLMSSPRRDHYLEPSTDDDTAVVLDKAVALLGTLRMPAGWLGDAGVELHLLASLIAETEHRLPEVVAGARDQGLSWAEIGDLLGVTRAAAWQRFATQAQAIQIETRRVLLADSR